MTSSDRRRADFPLDLVAAGQRAIERGDGVHHGADAGVAPYLHAGSPLAARGTTGLPTLTATAQSLPGNLACRTVAM